MTRIDDWPVMRRMFLDERLRIWADWRIGDKAPFADYETLEYFDSFDQACEISRFFGRVHTTIGKCVKADDETTLRKECESRAQAERARNRMKFCEQEP